MKSRGRILFASNDLSLVKSIRPFLAREGFDVQTAQTGNKALEHYFNAKYALVVLDQTHSGVSASKICQQILATDRNTPIIILSNRRDTRDCIRWLEAGCDDYLAKPFSTREFVARIRTVLRRYERAQRIARGKPMGRRISINGLEIDPEKRHAIISKRTVKLTAKEYELLCLLASNPGRIYSRRQLLDLLWDYDEDVYEHTVRSHINRLRKKIEPKPHAPQFILTAWGIGYRFSDRKPRS